MAETLACSDHDDYWTFRSHDSSWTRDHISTYPCVHALHPNWITASMLLFTLNIVDYVNYHLGHASLKSLFLFAAVTLLFPALPALADSLSYEAGIGFYCSEGATAHLLRYQHETVPLFGLSSYYEASYASWNGPNHADAFGLARGIRWGRTADEYLSLTVGLSHISRITDNLGQPFEFYGRLAYEKNVGKALFSMGWIHYSDAKFLFRWSGPNKSENFWTLSIGVLF
jgi:Lipid A 3-O-deacylase (PagL)